MALPATALNHHQIDINPRCGDPGRAQDIEQFATTAADVEHPLVRVEKRQILPKAILDQRLGAAKNIFEARIDASFTAALTAKAQSLLAILGGIREARWVGH